MSRRIHGKRVYFDPGTDIGWQLLVSGEFEQKELDTCKQFINDGSVVVDIGANIGLHTIAFSSMVPGGLVVSIEPAPDTFRWLMINTERLLNVVALNVAVSSQSGVSKFFVAADDAYSGLRDTRRKPVQNEIQVPCYTADQIVLPLLPNRIDMMKIDVEGLETEVLNGSRAIISRFRPVILCEVYGGKASNPDPIRTITSLTDENYRAYSFDGSTLRRFTVHDDRVYNYFFVPEEKVVLFPFLADR